MRVIKIIKAFIIVLLILVGSPVGFGQDRINLVDIPTADTLMKGRYFLTFRFYQEGGLLVRGFAGLTDRLTVGASYGGVNVVGTGAIEGNPEPAFSLKYKLGEEGENLPFALSFGYDGQGYGKYYKKGDKLQGKELTESFYQIDSKGFYLAASKELKNLHATVHGGINYSLKDHPAKPGISFFLGTRFEATPKLILKLEYNNGFYKEIKWEDVLKDASDLEGNLRKAGGEINLGVQIKYTEGLSLELAFKDLSNRYTESGNRVFQITYSGGF